MSVPPKTGEQILDAINFAVYAKHLANDDAGFAHWLDKCLDFDPAATLRWLTRALKQQSLSLRQQDICFTRLALRPKLRQVALRAGITEPSNAATDNPVSQSE